MPVDAMQVRNSLYLTVCAGAMRGQIGGLSPAAVATQQSMRRPPQASINVVMREDVARLSDVAKYRGMRAHLGSVVVVRCAYMPHLRLAKAAADRTLRSFEDEQQRCLLINMVCMHCTCRWQAAWHGRTWRGAAAHGITRAQLNIWVLHLRPVLRCRAWPARNLGESGTIASARLFIRWLQVGLRRPCQRITAWLPACERIC